MSQVDPEPTATERGADATVDRVAQWLLRAGLVGVLILLIVAWHRPTTVDQLLGGAPDWWGLTINDGRTKSCYHVTTGIPPTDVFAGKHHVPPRIFRLPPTSQPALVLSDVVVPLRIVWVGPKSTVTGSALVAPASAVTVAAPGPAKLAVVFGDGTKIAVWNGAAEGDLDQWWAATPPAPPTVKLDGPCGWLTPAEAVR
jgi:hypothetical protein